MIRSSKRGSFDVRLAPKAAELLRRREMTHGPFADITVLRMSSLHTFECECGEGTVLKSP